MPYTPPPPPHDGSLRGRYVDGEVFFEPPPSPEDPTSEMIALLERRLADGLQSATSARTAANWHQLAQDIAELKRHQQRQAAMAPPRGLLVEDVVEEVRQARAVAA
jgi:hypothetical protein